MASLRVCFNCRHIIQKGHKFKNLKDSLNASVDISLYSALEKINENELANKTINHKVNVERLSKNRDIGVLCIKCANILENLYQCLNDFETLTAPTSFIDQLFGMKKLKLNVKNNVKDKPAFFIKCITCNTTFSSLELAFEHKRCFVKNTKVEEETKLPQFGQSSYAKCKPKKSITIEDTKRPRPSSSINSGRSGNSNNNRIFHCHYERCKRKFRQETLLQIHLTRHVKTAECTYECEICNIFFKSQNGVTRHVNEVHLKMSNTINGISTCKICQEKFPSAASCLTHMKTHAQIEQDQKVSKAKTETTRNTDTTCQICKITFTRPDVLETHNNKYHPNNDIQVENFYSTNNNNGIGSGSVETKEKYFGNSASKSNNVDKKKRIHFCNVCHVTVLAASMKKHTKTKLHIAKSRKIKINSLKVVNHESVATNSKSLTTISKGNWGNKYCRICDKNFYNCNSANYKKHLTGLLHLNNLKTIEGNSLLIKKEKGDDGEEEDLNQNEDEDLNQNEDEPLDSYNNGIEEDVELETEDIQVKPVKKMSKSKSKKMKIPKRYCRNCKRSYSYPSGYLNHPCNRFKAGLSTTDSSNTNENHFCIYCNVSFKMRKYYIQHCKTKAHSIKSKQGFQEEYKDDDEEYMEFKTEYQNEDINLQNLLPFESNNANNDFEMLDIEEQPAAAVRNKKRKDSFAKKSTSKPHDFRRSLNFDTNERDDGESSEIVNGGTKGKLLSFACKYKECQQIFSTLKDYLDHTKFHDESFITFYCRHCKMEFKDKEEMQSHEITSHEDEEEEDTTNSRRSPRTSRTPRTKKASPNKRNLSLNRNRSSNSANSTEEFILPNPLESEEAEAPPPINFVDTSNLNNDPLNNSDTDDEGQFMIETVPSLTESVEEEVPKSSSATSAIDDLLSRVTSIPVNEPEKANSDVQWTLDNASGLYKCEICDFKDKSVFTLAQHIQSHQNHI